MMEFIYYFFPFIGKKLFHKAKKPHLKHKIILSFDFITGLLGLCISEVAEKFIHIHLYIKFRM